MKSTQKTMQTTRFPFTIGQRPHDPHRIERLATIIAGATLAAGLVLLPGVAAAQAQDSVADCVAVEDDAERLACFDRLTRGEPAAPEADAPEPASEPETPAPVSPSPSATVEPAARAPAEAPAPQAATPPPEAAPRPAETNDKDAFGLERQREAERLDRIVARVVGGFQGWGGLEKTVFELDNGQVWEQIGSGRFNYGGPDRAVEIRRASFGSFLLSPEGMNRSVRVRRLR